MGVFSFDLGNLFTKQGYYIPFPAPAPSVKEKKY